MGRLRRLAPERVLAFLMVSHSRLGESSCFSGLLQELVRRIIEEAHVWPRGPAGAVVVEGLVRLLGGGLLC